VASWVALDLRGLPRHHLQHQQQQHHSNGYDTLTIDSDFYGYAGSTTGSTAADPSNNSWSLHPDQDHHWRERDHSGSRHSASPAHYSSSSS
jgi:hypothetical protein